MVVAPGPASAGPRTQPGREFEVVDVLVDVDPEPELLAVAALVDVEPELLAVAALVEWLAADRLVALLDEALVKPLELAELLDVVESLGDEQAVARIVRLDTRTSARGPPERSPFGTLARDKAAGGAWHCL
jgi:hypothetical protein